MKHTYFWSRVGKWAKHFDKCVKCGLDTYSHLGHGMCHWCYYDEYKKTDKYKEYSREFEKRKRIEVLTHYGNGNMRCVCCGESTFEFLGLDHINGGGNKHRKSIKTTRVYDYLKRHGDPDGFQVLCHNCNMAIGFYGFCPHRINNPLVTVTPARAILRPTLKTKNPSDAIGRARETASGGKSGSRRPLRSARTGRATPPGSTG
jgi:hypothetical protein